MLPDVTRVEPASIENLICVSQWWSVCVISFYVKMAATFQDCVTVIYWEKNRFPIRFGQLSALLSSLLCKVPITSFEQSAHLSYFRKR